MKFLALQEGGVDVADSPSLLCNFVHSSSSMGLVMTCQLGANSLSLPDVHRVELGDSLSHLFHTMLMKVLTTGRLKHNFYQLVESFKLWGKHERSKIAYMYM